MIISKIDNTICKNFKGLSIHLKKHNLTTLEYLIKYEDFKIPKCPYCDNNRIFYAIDHEKPTFKLSCEDKECIKKAKSKIANNVSDETKEKQRNARLNYLSNKNNRQNTSWYKSAKHQMSFGENWLHEVFINNDFYNQYDIINEFVIYPYCADFAFVNEKVVVEFDGKCHFKNGQQRVDHDIKRDKILQSKGWRIFRIAYFEMKNFDIDILIKFIGNPKDKQFSDQLLKYKEYKQCFLV